MTTRDFYTAISVSNLSVELVDFAKAELVKMDARNDKRRSTMTKEQIANEQVKVNILNAIADGAEYASEIASACGISTQKASALCRQLVADGKATVEEVKVKGKGTMKRYAFVERVVDGV